MAGCLRYANGFLNGGGDTPLPTAEITSAQFMNSSGNLENWPTGGAIASRASTSMAVNVLGNNFVAGNIQLLFKPTGGDTYVAENPVSLTDTEVHWGKLNHATGIMKLMINGEQYGNTVAFAE